MLSTGNDIVSVNAINVTRTKQPNFYSKILTPTETALHQQPGFATIPFEVFVWLLWSMKESAFKFLQRIDADILFTPVKFEVSAIRIPTGFALLNFDKPELAGIGFDGFNTIQSAIKFGDHILHSNSFIYREFIATVVNDTSDFSQTHWGIKRIDSGETEIQSAEIRKFAVNNLGVTITKNSNGIPVAVQNDGKTIPISFSHHENWVAYSLQIN